MVKKPFIVIGIPIGLDFKIDLRLSVWATTMCERGNVVIKYEATRFCSEGMNKIIHYVLKNVKSATHVLLLNADEAPTRHDVLDLLLAADKDIVVGATPVVYGNVCWKVSRYEDGRIDGPFRPIPYAELPEQLFRAFDSGGPYLVKREVLEKMEWPYFFDLWDSKTSERIISHDLYFSRKATEYGFEIWCEPQAVFEHYKCVGLKKLTDTIQDLYGYNWGSWSITREDWGFIKGIIETEKIKTVLEFGSGLSSLLISGLVAVDSFETSEKCAERVRERVTNHKLKVLLWNGRDCSPPRGKYDLAFVDGPEKDKGRKGSVLKAVEYTNKIIMHDANRDHEAGLQAKYLQPSFELKATSGSCKYWIRKE